MSTIALPRSVLVVDDDASAVETLKDILAEKRFSVATADSGERAIAMARSARYDAVLMDIVMPGINGVEALRAIKAAAPGARVIMMTAFTSHELVAAARAATAMAVLPKPLEVERVLTLLETATGGAQA